MNELLRIFDEHYNEIGKEHRNIVHAKGYWHEVFHCWVIEKVDAEWHIYLQLRSKYKRDYPNQYDITAAGHLLASETIEDGIRELEEELGLKASYSQLISLGVIPYYIDHENIKDYEFAHVFVYRKTEGIEQFALQREELDGIYAAKLEQFIQLAERKREEIEVTGYKYENDGKYFEAKRIGLKQMAALPESYLRVLIPRLKNMMFEAT